MGVGAGLYMYDVVVKKFTFAISCPDELLFFIAVNVHSCNFSQPIFRPAWATRCTDGVKYGTDEWTFGQSQQCAVYVR